MKMKPSRRRLTGPVIEQLLLDSDPWLSCDDCFDLTDACVEDLIVDARPPDEALRVHLNACPACLEDVVSLLALVAEERGVDPKPLELLLAP